MIQLNEDWNSISIPSGQREDSSSAFSYYAWQVRAYSVAAECLQSHTIVKRPATGLWDSRDRRSRQGPTACLPILSVRPNDSLAS